jgi:hypothetical protein
MSLHDGVQQVTERSRVRQVIIFIAYVDKLVHLKVDDFDGDECRPLKKTDQVKRSKSGSSRDYRTNYPSQETSSLQLPTPAFVKDVARSAERY